MMTVAGLTGRSGQVGGLLVADMIMMIQSRSLPSPHQSLLPAAGTVIQVLISHEGRQAVEGCPPSPPSLPPSLSLIILPWLTLSPVYTLAHNT